MMGKFKYTNVFTMEINDVDFHLRERILGSSVSLGLWITHRLLTRLPPSFLLVGL